MGELKNEFSWSKSRDALFRECPRAYFYHYYGAWGGFSPKAPQAARALYDMKGLASRPTFKGSMVHEIAEWAMEGLRQRRPYPLEQALLDLERRMRTELKLSSEGKFREWFSVGSHRVKSTPLQEHYYQEAVTEDEWEALIQESLECVRTLYTSPTFHRLSTMDPSGILSIEVLQSFPVDDVKVWVTLDLAIRRPDGCHVIVDWKTGASHKQEDIALQLGIYGLFGTQVWNISPDQILGFDVNLRDGSTHQHAMTLEQMGSVTEYIRSSAADMRARLINPSENVGEVDAFPPISPGRTCQRCRFRRACKRE